MANATTLAHDHMVHQVQDAAVIQAGLSLAFDKTLNTADLDRSFPTFLRASLALVSAGHDKAVQTATNYYGAAKKGAGFESVVPLIAAPKLNLEHVAEDLLVSGPVSIKTYLSNGLGLAAATEKAKANVLRVGKSRTLEGGREHLINLTKNDKDAVAWSRVSDGQPCHFCAMLVSRGPVYSEKTSDFKAHRGCGCSVRPVFKDEADGGWSPDAKALSELWEAEGGDLALWRKAYSGAVNDPGSAVFKTFTDKVAVHISNPAVVAARREAQKAYDAARTVQKAAEAEAVNAATKIAQEAAQAEAKAAAKEAAKIKKWKGKPAPVKPLEPKPGATIGEAAFDPWLADVKARFKAFADKTGNPKNDLTKSLNWNYVEKVIKQHDMGSLDALKSMQYVDDALYKQAKDAMKRANLPVPGAAAAYEKDYRLYKGRATRYKRYIQEWREVNGITADLGGMDDALRHASDHAGVAWANSALPQAKGKAKAAIKTYSGSSYGPWNNDLRRLKDPDKLPPGRFETLTAEADAAFTPLPESVIVHRGGGFEEFDIDGKRLSHMPPPPLDSLIGTIHGQDGYMSTSVGNSSAFGGPVRLKLRVPQGHGATWVDPYSLHKGERELLLQRGTRFFIHDVYKDTGSPYSPVVVEAEVIPMEADAAAYANLPPMPSKEKWDH